MLCVLDGEHAVVEEPGLPAPHHDVSMLERNTTWPIAAPGSAPEEDGRKSERHGNDRGTEVRLVAVPMHREPRPRFVAIDETGIGHEVHEAHARRRPHGELPER